ncbi:MAG: hypothetical protein ACK56F_04410, partial [bacterium]
MCVGSLPDLAKGAACVHAGGHERGSSPIRAAGAAAVGPAAAEPLAGAERPQPGGRLSGWHGWRPGS